MPSLKNKHETLIDDGIIVLNKKYNRYDICNEKVPNSKGLCKKLH